MFKSDLNQGFLEWRSKCYVKMMLFSRLGKKIIHVYGLCYVLNYVSQNLYDVTTPVTQNVIIFGNKFFKEAIKLK